MNSPSQYFEAQINHQAQIKHFHKQYKLSQPQTADRLFCCYQNNALLGVARCVPVIPTDSTSHPQWWLRGLFIKPEYRHQGHATQLINHLTTQLDNSLFAFAQPQLSSFYQRLGFVLRPAEKLIEPQLALFQRYQKTKPQLHFWCRSISTTNTKPLQFNK